MNFTPGFDILTKDPPEGYWFLFFDGELLLTRDDDAKTGVPFLSNMKERGFDFTDYLYIGSVDGSDCYAANLDRKNAGQGFSFNGLRQLYRSVQDDWFPLISRAFHLTYWASKNKYCGCCGAAMIGVPEESALKCVSCGQIVYPRISPAVIVAVVRDRQILLARAGRFPTAMYSVLAGFVEPGESLEDCVRREIREEVGIEVKEIKYFASQPWPFPDSLMIGFTAQYASGEIVIDNKEIVDAAWYSAGNLPEIPPGKSSISRRLIDWFVRENT